MSGVGSFTAGEASALMVAAGLAKDVAGAVLAYAPTSEVEDVYNDLASALVKLGPMATAQINDNEEETPDGAADSV